jgi:serine protease Do
VVIKIQDRQISSKSSFDEHMSYYRPGDKIKLVYMRAGSNKETTMTLTNEDGETGLSTKSVSSSEKLGADFSAVSMAEKQKYKISNGVKVSNIRNGFINRLGIEDGFIFIKYNEKPCNDAAQLIKDLESAQGRIMIEGIDANGNTRIYNYWY